MNRRTSFHRLFQGSAVILTLLAVTACTGNRTAPRTGADAGPQTAVKVLQAKRPGSTWNAGSRIQGDFDQDGRADEAFTGGTKDHVLVGVVAGPASPSSRSWVLEFPRKGGGENALCSDEAKIAAEPLDEGTTAGAHKATAKKPAKPGMGINLHDDLCDAFHIYWDADKKDFLWWRL